MRAVIKILFRNITKNGCIKSTIKETIIGAKTSNPKINNTCRTPLNLDEKIKDNTITIKQTKVKNIVLAVFTGFLNDPLKIAFKNSANSSKYTKNKI
ncbi:MAG: hypothetical protein WCK10_02770 [Candidatus Staskawiczbacteria bacterium]